MKVIKYFLPTIMLSGLFLTSKVYSQHKFEIGVNVDPLVIPLNLSTYVENGPGFYDINGRGKITQSGSAYFTYWPFHTIGISLGVDVRSFRSEIDYSIPDPLHENSGPLIERSYPFKARGWGPSLAIITRIDRWRARIGLEIFDLHDQEYNSNSSFTGVSIFESGVGTIVEVQLEEEAYWRYVPQNYGFVQFEGQYNISENFFIHLSFETTFTGKYPYPYTLQISGFTPETSPEFQVLNDYEMRNTLTSISLGVGYILGFGKYRRDGK